MRAANVAAALGCVVSGLSEPASAQVQVERRTVTRGDGGVGIAVRKTGRSEPVPSVGGGRVYGPHDGHHHHGGLPYGFGYAPFSGGYEGLSVYGPGYGFNYYNGPVYGGLPINPPVYVYPPVGYVPAYYPPVPGPLDPSLIRYQHENDWNALSAQAADLARRNEGDLIPGTGAVPVPSTPEAKLKSLRYQAQGDEAFRGQDYVRAAGLYRQAFTTAKDNAPAFFRMGYAQVAAGMYGSAVEYFKRGLALDPAIAITGTTPDELYGPDNGLAWTSHLGRVTRWVAEDVRNSDRVLLLGLLLYSDGDSRAREFLTKAWQLSGGTETAVLPLLNPPKVDGVTVKEAAPAAGGVSPAEGEPVEPAEGPAVGSGAVGGGVELPVVPGVPDAAVLPGARPEGQAPLFPLPSEQGEGPSEPGVPPLPAPAAGDTPGGSR